MFVDVNVRIKLVCICTINGFLLPKFKHWWWPNHRHSKEQPQKACLSDIAICSHVQIHCACQCIVTLAPKILWPTALLNAWTIMTFPKSSFYHTNHTFLASINVWMMDFSSINVRIKKFRPRRTPFYVESDFFKNSRFTTTKEQFLKIHNILLKEPSVNLPPLAYIYIYVYTCVGLYCIWLYIHSFDMSTYCMFLKEHD